MKNEILLSHLIGLISVSHETKNVQLAGGDLAYIAGLSAAVTAPFGVLHIKWKRGTGSGCEIPHLSMKSAGVRENNSYSKIVLRAYYYQGDNCNERTRFLYWLMADDVDIIDNLGICGHGSEIGKTYLTKLSAYEYSVCMVNARGRTPIYKNGKWTYKEEENDRIKTLPVLRRESETPL